jgi:hypothetical protein
MPIKLMEEKISHSPRLETYGLPIAPITKQLLMVHAFAQMDHKPPVHALLLLTPLLTLSLLQILMLDLLIATTISITIP